MEVRVQKILGKKVNRQQNIWPKSMCYAGGVQTYMRVVEGNTSALNILLAICSWSKSRPPLTSMPLISK